MTITALQADVLRAIVESDFHDGADPVGNWVWSDCLYPKIAKGKQIGAVMSMLVQRGLARTDATCCCITQEGIDELTRAAA